MEYKIEGDNLQAIKITLKDNEEVYAEAGKMMFKTSGINMETMMKGQGIGAKLFGAVKRKIAGESLFTTHFTGNGTVGFAGDYPGRINAIKLEQGKTFLAQRDAFICAESTIDFSIAFQKKIGAGIFGGEGFILEKFTGPGTVFIHAGGDFLTFDLKSAETIQVDTGCIVGFDENVNYDIKFVGGIKTAVFGGEGLFLTTLTGPGKVILQTMNLARLRRELGGSKTGGGEKTGISGIVKSFIGSED